MGTILRLLLALIRLLWMMIFTLLTLTITSPFFYLSGKSRRVSYATARIWGRVALFVFNVKILGQIPQEKVILMSNHQTFIDIFLVLGFYPSSIVAKKEIGRWPILHFAVSLGRIILVDRGTLKGAIKTMHDINTEIKNGGSVILSNVTNLM
ncbi:MAG: lysophospholipid acyltransferase family protein, partial [Bacteroidales bacterium]|nr:lysophospholipid acyltransferase family protein [Bacteroidales bacterium]